jgi:hypothetical protein
MSDSGQTAEKQKKFTLGPLGTVNQVCKALSKVIRGMADGSIDSQKGARIANALGILRMAMETREIAQLTDRLDKLETDQGIDHVDRSGDRDVYRHHHH